MGDRIVKIKLLADATGAVQGFSSVRDAAAETKAKVMESAQSQRAEWATVGAGLAAVGVAVTGIGIAALKTGIEYNTLQQTTRAALTTLLGSAKAANAQMDKLDAFARKSPFAKQTFITAQQQMLAFGVETRKVIPYMDALQNAVAAAGGSNNDIAELAEIFGKVQSSAKITAVDLQQFGTRGVNAADLIGSQMGKTGAQIRAEITAGTLDATKALDALAAGMSERYSGAADNVKNTFAGAMDRVKAAWRDFSAELAKPLVDPNGGGMLVDLLNWTADAMRNFQALPEPVKNTASAVVGLGGASALLLGTSMMLLPKWLEFLDAVKKISPAMSPAMGAMRGVVSFLTGPWGLALTAAATLAAVLFMENQKLVSQGREFADTLDEQTGALTDNSKAWAANQLQQDGVLAAAKRLGISASDMTNAWLGQADAVELVNSRIRKFYDDAEFRGKNIEGNDNWFKDLAKLEGALDGSNTVLSEAKSRHEELAEATRETGEATGNAASTMGSSATAYSEASEKASQLQGQLMGLIDAVNELNGTGQSAERANSALQTSFEKLQEYVKKAQDGVDGYVLSLDGSTSAGASNRAMLADHASSIEKNAKAQLDVESRTIGATEALANYESRLSSGRQQIYDTALALSGNADEAQKLTDKIMAMPDQKALKVLLQGAQEVENQLATLSRRRETTIGVRYEGGAGTMTRAYGGTIGYASGGTIGGAAFGKTIGGFGGGVAGGTVFGAGGTKSDSVLVRLSRGEEVIQEPYASMYRKELKQMNRGDFVSQQQPQIVVVSGGGNEQPQIVNNWNGQFIGEPPQAWSEDANQKQRRAQESHGVRDIR